jgi:hypothetical protein
MFQTAANLCMALDFNKRQDYQGLVWGLCASMNCFAMIVPVITGTVVVEPEGEGGSGKEEPADVKGLKAKALQAVHKLRGCDAVEALAPGKYWVGKFYYSDVSGSTHHLECTWSQLNEATRLLDLEHMLCKVCRMQQAVILPIASVLRATMWCMCVFRYATFCPMTLGSNITRHHLRYTAGSCSRPSS